MENSSVGDLNGANSSKRNLITNAAEN